MKEDNLILIVDDDPQVLFATVRILKKAGYTVITASSGYEGLQTARERMPDLLLLDVMLPDIDGIEVCKHLKGGEMTSHLFVCLLSGLRRASEEQALGLESGADDYIARPIENRELLARVQAMLRLINAEKELYDNRKQLKRLVEERTAQLFINEAQFRLLTESIKDVFWMSTYGLEEIVYISPSYQRLWERDIELVYKESTSFLEALHPDDMDAYLDVIASYHAKGKAYACEYRIIKKDGEIRWISERGYPVEEPLEGQLLMSGICTDISEQKRIEIALRESEEKYRSMMESMDDAAYICSADYRIEYMNSAMIEKIGRDATGEQCHTAIFGRQEQCPWCQHEKVMRGETLKTEFEEPGTGNVYSISHSPIFHTNGTISTLSLYHDITETKKLEARIQQAQKMESIGSLAGGIAHDFNNILCPIIGMSELLMLNAPHGSQVYEDAQMIFNAGKRGGDLVKQILSFSRQSKHTFIPVYIQQILKEVLKLSRSSIPTYIEIEQDIQTDCSSVLANPTQIHQVIMNIMTNAYHAVEASSGRIIVTLHETSPASDALQDIALSVDQYALLSITDSGHGIPADLMDKIFDPYFTTKEQGKGTGLGLAVAYGIIKEHKGEIQVCSEVGKGSTFNVYIPLMDKQVVTNTIGDSALSPTGKEHILLVDDEEPIALLEKKMLEQLGYQVTMHIHSPEALEAFRAEPDVFDLVISDMAMPSMTGDQLAMELLAIRHDIPIIISSGFSERLNNGRGAKIGIKDFLEKPFLQSKLAKTVRKVLDAAKFEN
ncbi:histidine kinase [Candidatus Electrothrix aarhusensis]